MFLDPRLFAIAQIKFNIFFMCATALTALGDHRYSCNLA